MQAPESAENPFAIVPSGLPDYNEWRIKRAQLRAQCLRDPQVMAAEYQRCKYDIVHWMFYWGWIFNPIAPPDMMEQMFLPWEFQQKLAYHWRDCIEKVANPDEYIRINEVLEKAREMAASWTACYVAVHDWLFWNGSHIFVSYKEALVDNKGDMKSLFEKMRFIIYRLPEWQLPPGWNPRIHDKHLLLDNPTGGEISGEATTKQSSRGGRARCVWFDEFAFFINGTDESAWAAASQTAKMRVAISTPNGMHNKFYRMRTRQYDPETGKNDYMDSEGQTVIRLDWWLNPTKTQGLRVENGKRISPWYLENKRTLDKQTFAREIEIDYRMSQKGWIFDEYTYDHKWGRNLKPEPGRRIIRGWDAGAHFMVVFGQIDSYRRLLLFKELYFENRPLAEIAKKVLEVSAREFPGAEFEDFGDPAGASVYTANQIGNRSEWMELQVTHGILIQWHFMNRIVSGHRQEARIQAIQRKMGGHCEQKNTPMLLINERDCPILDRAFGGEYMREIDSQTGEVGDKAAEEHPIEDGMDCTGYILLGKGEGAGFTGNSGTGGGVKAKQRRINWAMPGGR